MDDVVLWGHKLSLQVVYEDDIACMVWQMTNVYAMVGSFFPFSRTKSAKWQRWVKNVNRGSKHFEIIWCLICNFVCEESER